MSLIQRRACSSPPAMLATPTTAWTADHPGLTVPAILATPYVKSCNQLRLFIWFLQLPCQNYNNFDSQGALEDSMPSTDSVQSRNRNDTSSHSCNIRPIPATSLGYGRQPKHTNAHENSLDNREIWNRTPAFRSRNWNVASKVEFRQKQYAGKLRSRYPNGIYEFGSKTWWTWINGMNRHNVR